MVCIWELSESEPIEDVSKLTFILSKSRGRAALRDKLTSRVRNIAKNYLSAMWQAVLRGQEAYPGSLKEQENQSKDVKRECRKSRREKAKSSEA